MSVTPPKKIWIIPLVLTALIALLWAFPAFWYARHGEASPIWFTERSEIPGWQYTYIPVEKSAERILVADRSINGEFTRPDGSAIRVFSAKRYQEKSNEIGLFVHTPDRCWVESGWQIEPSSPEVQELTIHGVRLALERRIFKFGADRELVYFCGLVGGQTLPYRLDHNLSVGVRTALKQTGNPGQAAARASDTHFWKRLWTSFTSRRDLFGPKHFIRISTPVYGSQVSEADARLTNFLSQWLAPGNYDQERAALNLAAR